MRNTFIDELILAARKHDNIVLIVGDLGYGVVEPFAQEFPDRFYNAGVAEQNMMGLAAGLASEGFHVFVYSIANFPSFRCAEQIRNDVDHHNLPVTIVAVGGGLSYGALGYSHHAIQDYALFRSFPNTLIAAPGDPMEVSACLRYLIANPQPSYLRLGKTGEPCFHSAVPTISPGQWLCLQKGSTEAAETLLTTGAALETAMKQYSGTHHAVYSLPLWSMKAKTSQADFLKLHAKVMTVEDHLQDGGFGSWLMESVQTHPTLLSRISSKALDPRVCDTVGSQATLNAFGGL